MGRVGTQHQAGSDSLVTSELFFKLKKDQFTGKISPKFHNVLFSFDNGGIPTETQVESQDEEDDEFYYPQSNGTMSTMSEGYSDQAQHQSSGMYYGSTGYYRAPTSYAPMNTYYMPSSTAFPAATSMSHPMYGVYSHDTVHDGHIQ